MRVSRVVTGVLAGLLGLLGAVAGGVTAFALIGPDDVLTTGTHRLTTRGVAIATAPDLIHYYDARLVVTAEPVRRGQQVFVGVGNHVDVDSYLAGSAGARVVEFGFPSTLRTSPVSGAATRRVPPGRLGWWVAEESGSGTRTLSWRLADGPYDVVVMNADGRPGVDVQVTAGVEFPGVYRLALVVFAVGLLLLLVAVVVLVRRRRPRAQGRGRARVRLRRRRREDDDELLWEGREAWEENEYWAAGPSAERSDDERPSWLDPPEAQPLEGAEPPRHAAVAEPPPAREASAGEPPPDRVPTSQTPAHQVPTHRTPTGRRASDDPARRPPAGPPPSPAAAPRRAHPGWESSGNGSRSGPVPPALPWRPGTRRPTQPPTSPRTSSRPDRLHDGRPGRPDTRDSDATRDTRDTRDTGDGRETGDVDDQRR